METWVLLMKYKEGQLYYNNTIPNITRIQKIEYLSLSEGFQEICSQFEGFGYFGEYGNQRYLLSNLINTPTEPTLLAGTNNKGIKIILSGRLGGVSMAKTYKLTYGSVKTQTIGIKVDYKDAPILTKWGSIGQKIFIS